MPRAAQHRAIGQAVGGLTALIAARNQPPLQIAAETAGGFLLGDPGGVLADLLEPATSSHHRGVFHSAAFNTTLVSYALANGPAAQHWLRAHAAHHFALAATTDDPVRQLLHTIAALVLHVIAGAIIGLPAAMASHALLDARTARSIPLALQGI